MEAYAKSKYEKLPKFPVIPDGCIGESFTLSTDERVAQQQIQKARKWLVKRHEVMAISERSGFFKVENKTEGQFATSHLSNNKTKLESSENTGTDPEKIIRSLTFSRENNHEISIKSPHNKVLTLKQKDLNVQDKTWLILQSIVRDGYYRIPHKAKSEGYGSTHKTFYRLNKKIVIFLNQNLGTSIPETFHVIINDRHQRGVGHFSPIFNVKKDSRNKWEYDDYKDEELLENFYRKAKEQRRSSNSEDIDEDFINIVKAVKERELLSDREIEDAIHHETDAKTIKDEFKTKLDKSAYQSDDPEMINMEVTEEP